MIISKTPLRIEFTGGSDLPAFYKHEPGAIVNVTIDKHIYVLIRHPNFPRTHSFDFKHEKMEKCNNLNKIQHVLIKETLKLKKIKDLSLTSFSDLPSQTGLGSSGAFLVGLLNALYHLDNKKISSKEIASEAFYIESNLAKVKCGPQDQMAAAHGGLRLHEFYPSNKVKSSLVTCSQKSLKKLEESLLMFYTGNQRPSLNYLNNLWMTLEKSRDARKLMSQRVSLSHLMAKKIRQNSLISFPEMLDEDWRLKKEIAPIETNAFIDSIYTKAKKSGAVGGKLVGAGGSGFMLFYAPKEKHEQIKKTLLPLRNMNFKFSNEGSRIISTLP